MDALAKSSKDLSWLKRLEAAPWAFGGLILVQWPINKMTFFFYIYWENDTYAAALSAHLILLAATQASLKCSLKWTFEPAFSRCSGTMSKAFKHKRHGKEIHGHLSALASRQETIQRAQEHWVKLAFPCQSRNWWNISEELKSASVKINKPSWTGRNEKLCKSSTPVLIKKENHKTTAWHELTAYIKESKLNLIISIKNQTLLSQKKKKFK